MATQADISKVIARLSAAFPNWNLSKYTMQVYFEDLQDIPADELEEAARACRMQDGRSFAPTIGELREAWQIYREQRATKHSNKQLTGPEPVYVPMPQYCIDELDAFFKAKGHRSKYREFYQHVSEASRK